MKLLVILNLIINLSTSIAFASLGFKEAMLADSGITNTCSSEQYLLNPAGIYCEKKKNLIESSATTGLSIQSHNIETTHHTSFNHSDNTKILVSDSNFGQIYHLDTHALGIWGKIESRNYNLIINSSTITGSYDYAFSETRLSLGGTYSQFMNKWKWGIAAHLQQNEKQNFMYGTFQNSGNYYSTVLKTVYVENQMGIKTGLIYTSDFNFKIGVAFEQLFPINGNYQSDRTTTTTTSGSYQEFVENGKYRTNTAPHISLGAEYSLFTKSALLMQIDWKGAETMSTENATNTQTETNSEIISTAIGYKSQVSLNTEARYGVRYFKSLPKSNTDPDNSSILLAGGLIRTYKDVELGTSINLTQMTTKSKIKEDGSITSGSQSIIANFLISSSYSY